AHVTNNRGKKNLVLSAWGDESVLSEEHFNPYFDLSYYQSYSEQAQKNLKRVNEDVIDYDLIEDLICYIDESCGEGAILVFLPGVFEINHLHDKLAASYQFGGPSSDWIIPLHSSVASTEQKKVFLRPPGNIRKCFKPQKFTSSVGQQPEVDLLSPVSSAHSASEYPMILDHLDGLLEEYHVVIMSITVSVEALHAHEATV
ncbi:ATP-dependent RNA helicase DHX29-like, partial [Trifolium medium]|nr:ATP-dependent RNA helicase DHX29-like [Trifolium medium]